MRRKSLFACAVLLGFCAPALAQTAPEPAVTKAADGIFAAFQTHPLVGLGDMEGSAQEDDFYTALLRDPRFATEVGNLVLETGDAAQQAVIDRFVAGESVPYAQLRKVWTETPANDPTQFFLGMINLFDSVRLVNRNLPPEKRVKVWLSDPPIDWSKIHSKAELDPIIAQRETFPADLIGSEILARGKKALVIYGGQHFADMGNIRDSHFEANNLRALMEKAHPGAFFYVAPYMGNNTPACNAAFEKDAAGWTAPALIAPIRGTALEADLLPPGCGSYPILPGMSQAEYTTMMRNYAGLTADALLYLGPRKQLMWSPWAPDIYMDTEFRAEMDRRHQIRGRDPMGYGWNAWNNPAMLNPMFPN